MAGTFDSQIQQAYVAFFNRPADFGGLVYWNDQATKAGGVAPVLAAFGASAEYKALYEGKSPSAIIETIYQNLFNRAAEPAALEYWGLRLANGTFNIGQIANAIVTGAQNADKVNIANKVIAATSFTAALDTNPKILGYETTTAAGAQAVKDWLKAVTNDAATLPTAASVAAIVSATVVASTGAITVGQTFTLTTGVDTLVGTAGNDTFNAPTTDGGTATLTLGGLDGVDGGAGTDTLNVDFGAAAATLPATVSIKNIEVLNVSSNTSANIDVTGIAGVQKVGVVNGSTAGTTVVKGGEVVSVTGGGTAGVTGNALTSVTATKTAVVTVSNDSAALGAGKGTTLKSVEIVSTTGATASLTGEAIETVAIKNQKSTLTATVTNTIGKALNVNVEGVGYQADGTTAAAAQVIAGAAAETLTVGVAGAKNALTVTEGAAGKVKTLNVTGAGNVVLTAGATALTTINGSAATGNLELVGTTIATNVKTGAGNDKFTLASSKVTVDAGAGNDIVTLGGAALAGSTINLGAGDDVLKGAAATVAASTATAITVVDAGAGFDTVSAAMVNAANAKQFLNFEALDLSDAVTNLDVSLMTGSKIEALTVQANNGAAAKVSEVAAGVGLKVIGEGSTAGAATAAATVVVKDSATNIADTFAVTFDGKATATATAAAADKVGASVVLANIETVTVASAGTGFVANKLTLSADKLQTVTITGDKAFELAFTGTNGTNATGPATGGAVKMIDGSAATGNLTIADANVTADNKAGVGLTIKTGSGKDVITLTNKATVNAGAGDDKVVVSVNGATVTGGEGKDSIDVSLAKYDVAKVITTITDFSAGDTIKIGTTTTATTATKIVLDATVQDFDGALAQATAGTAGGFKWFAYGADTYLVSADIIAGAGADDIVVKLTGTVDLSSLAFSADGAFIG